MKKRNIRLKILYEVLLSRTTHHRRVACRAEPCEPSRVGQVVLEHAQKLFASRRWIGFQPPVLNWLKVSDISKGFRNKFLNHYDFHSIQIIRFLNELST